MKRIAIASFIHEGNSFSPVPTTTAEFRQQLWLSGCAAKEHARGTRTELGAAVDFLDTHRDWQGLFLTCAEAGPAGPIDDMTFALIRDEILDGLSRGPWDAVYLALHGAMLSASSPTADLDLLRAVRRAIGRAPLGVSFDLHANLGAAQIGLFDVACGFKTHPHVDMYETAARTLELLARTASGEIAPKGALAKVPAILPSMNMRTTDGPMAEIEAIAAEVERRHGLLDVSVFGGFSYGDSPLAGASVMVHADGDAELAQEAAHEVGAAMTARLDRFYVALPTPTAALMQAAGATAWPVALIESSDNPGSGGIGDTTGLFAAMHAARPPGPAVFAFFADPGVVGQAAAAGIGGRVAVTLGGRIAPEFGAPVAISGTVNRLTDGRFRNSGPLAHGAHCNLGRTALVRDGELAIIVTAACQSPNDPGFFTLHDIDVHRLRWLGVKAKNHFRAAFRPLIPTMIDVDTPGPAALDLRHFRFRHAPMDFRRS